MVEVGETRPYEEIWSLDNGHSAVHYIEDGLLGLLYVVVLGEHVDEVEASLRRALETVRPKDALEWLEDAASAERRVQAAAYLAASAERPALDLIEAFDRLMRDPVADVRRAAIFAATYPAWPDSPSGPERRPGRCRRRGARGRSGDCADSGAPP